MVAMSASGWEGVATDGSGPAIQVLRAWRPNGVNGERRALVQLNLAATNFGGGAELYPSTGIPLPDPSLMGFRSYIAYGIPFGPLMRRKQGIVGKWPIPWGVMAPTTPPTPGYIRLIDPRMTTCSGGATSFHEPVTTMNATSLFSTDVYTAYALFVGY